AVLSLIDRAHAAFTEKGENFVAFAEDVPFLQHDVLIRSDIGTRAAGSPHGRAAFPVRIRVNHSGAWISGWAARRWFYKRRAVIAQGHFAGRAFAFGRGAQSTTGVLSSTRLGLQLIHENFGTQAH